MKSRPYLIAANWKLNGSTELAHSMHHALAAVDVFSAEILICPPVLFLHQFPKLRPYQLGAQTVSDQAQGAFTGEVSARMLADAGVSYVIIGHSERRALYHEDAALIIKKATQAVLAKITPIICFGETLAEKKQEKTFEVIANQLDAVYAAQPELLLHSVIAYEPIWAIGTGETATPAQAQAVHAFIRQHVAKLNADVAKTIRIIYGGSVNASNSAELFSQPDIDGGLVGGASLKPDEFISICQSVRD